MFYKKLIMEPTETEESIIIDRSKTILMTEPISEHRIDQRIQNRNYGNFKGRSYYLSPAFDWVIGKDSDGWIVLVPLRK